QSAFSGAVTRLAWSLRRRAGPTAVLATGRASGTRLAGIASAFVALRHDRSLLLAYRAGSRRHPDIGVARTRAFDRALFALAEFPATIPLGTVAVPLGPAFALGATFALGARPRSRAIGPLRARLQPIQRTFAF